MFRGGYAGKILRIDLSQRKTTTVDYPEELRRKYLGGRGVAAYLYFQELPAALGPLSSGNKIFFMTSRKLAIHRTTISNFAFPYHLNFALSALLLRQAGSGENSGFTRESR